MGGASDVERWDVGEDLPLASRRGGGAGGGWRDDRKETEMKGQPAIVRLFKRVEKQGNYGCWTWLGVPSSSGYGGIQVNGRTVKVHRLSYTLLVGPIGEGLTIDHICRNKLCVNPRHLEPVTRRVNTLRGVGPAAVYARRTACGRGHSFTAENTLIRPNKARRCRVCRRDSNREAMRRWRACARVRALVTAP